jgi:hypothetical protein
MRSAMWLLWSSVVCASGAERAFAGGGVSIEAAQAGQPLCFEVRAEREGEYEVKARVEQPDGTLVCLPSLRVIWPRPPREGFHYGPTLPSGSGGGTVVVEVFEVATGRRLGTGVSPVSF